MLMQFEKCHGKIQGSRGRGRANDSNKCEQKHWFDTLDEIRQDETFESDSNNLDVEWHVLPQNV